MEKTVFSDDIKALLRDELGNPDIYSMSKEELEEFRKKVVDKRHEYSLIELAFKTLGNAGYGACANEYFYFFNPNLAADITAECRRLTKTFWYGWPEYFHETVWKDKDLQKKYNFEFDESKHDWYRQQNVVIYCDTDSCYVSLGSLFSCFTPEYQKLYDTPEKKREWIYKFCQGHMNSQNKEWCDRIYTPRHAHSIHNFELETIQLAGIFLAKKHNVKGVIWNKGKLIDCNNPKFSATGVELVKSTTPPLARDILMDLVKTLLYDAHDGNSGFFMYFWQKVLDWRKRFFAAPVEDISQSVNIGDYTKYVEDDENQLILRKQCPVSVQAIARYNMAAHKAGMDNLKLYSGKIKYYAIRQNKKSDVGYFGFPAGELPDFAPECDRTTQWQKTVIDPINRFMTVMNMPELGAAPVLEQSLF